MFDGLFIFQRVSTPIFCLNTKIFHQIIFVWEIIMLDDFLIQLEVFIRVLDVAMWKIPTPQNKTKKNKLE